MTTELIERAEWLADKIMGSDYILESADVLRKMAKAMRAAQSGGAPAVVADDGALIPWIGNKSSYTGPVPADALIDIKFRNGEVCCRCLAGNYSWRDTQAEDDIIAYRLSPAAAPTAQLPAPASVAVSDDEVEAAILNSGMQLPIPASRQHFRRALEGFAATRAQPVSLPAELVKPCEVYGPDRHMCCGREDGHCDFDRIPKGSA